jgi:MOSC domain-containing protein YiiM
MNVESVSASPRHRFSKQRTAEIELDAGTGVVGDAHRGVTVQHLSRKRYHPDWPNLRQVHLMQAELLDELCERGFAVAPGDIGENVTTRGVDLLGLPTGARLRLGSDAEVELTGLRNPCLQLDRFQDGLMQAVLDHDQDGNLIRKAGVMAVVITGGLVRPGDPIALTLPAGTPRPLQAV